MARTTIYDLAKKNLSKMKVSDLKAFIRKVSQKVARDRRSKFKAVAASADYIANLTGIRKYKDKSGKRRVSLKLGFTGMRKQDLLARARMLQGHLNIDVYTKDAKRYAEEIAEETLKTFERNTGFSFTAEEFHDFKSVLAALKDLIEKFGSDEIAKMYDEVNRRGGRTGRLTLGSILRNVYDDNKGADKQTLIEAAYKRINELFDGIYDDTF